MNDGRQEQMRLTPRCKYRQPFAHCWQRWRTTLRNRWVDFHICRLYRVAAISWSRSYRQPSSGWCWSDHRITHRTNSFIRVLSFLLYRDRPQRQFHCLVFPSAPSKAQAAAVQPTHSKSNKYIAARFFTSIHQNLAKDVAQEDNF